MRCHVVRQVLVSLLLVGLLGCGGDGTGNNNGDGGNGDGGGPDARPCQGLECQQVDCTGGGTTSLSGIVYTPAGDLPLYNVIVYVPNAPVLALVDGVSCDQCDDVISGSPLVRTTTDTEGRFTLIDVPVGADIPLVIQIGKWRRQVTIADVPECTDTPLPLEITRLPRNKAEGDIPRIALTTGGADALECFLRKVGIDDSEFTNDAGGGRVTLFAAVNGTADYTGALGGDSFDNATQLWDDATRLAQYDILLLSCEGTENPTNKSMAARQNLMEWTAIGGRVFASHWHNFWIEFGPQPWPDVATFDHQADLPDPFTGTIDQSFPKGADFAEWLMNVAGSTTLGELVIHAAQHTIDAVNLDMAQQWIFSTAPTSVQYLTFNTPVDVQPEDQCGRIVLSDIHVASDDVNNVGDPFPSGCTSIDLLPQEKALMFMLFDLSSCIEPDVQ